jgi:dTDP-4-dehydrorhamnose reductase
MKILILGSKGQLGKCLSDQFQNINHEVLYTSREQIDVANFELTKKQILKISPELIINASAYTAVDKAEEDKKTAKLINHLAVSNIAEICNQLDCWLIHFSTDYVFDGKSNKAYKEIDQTNPQSTYGETKLNGELEIQSSGCKHIILRTAWVFSEYGNNFLKTILRIGQARDELDLIDDQIGCPTYAQDIARIIAEIVPKLYSQKKNGVYHFCGDQSCSWYEFATEIFNYAKSKKLKIPRTINPIKTSAYFTPAKRPAFSVLDCSKIENDFGIQASNWQKGIRRAIDKLKLKAI